MLGKEWLTNAIAANVADYMMMKGGITVWGGLHTVSRIGEDHIADSGDFERSLKPVIDKVLAVIELPEDKFEAIEVSVELERAFKGLVTSVWEAVWYKWSFAFTEYKRYKEGYAIQHTKGVFAIHSVLEGCADFFDDTLPLSQALWSVESKFRTILERSEITESDWLVGGTFSSFKDVEGYQKIADILEINRLVHKERANVGNEDVNGWKETSMGEYESWHIYVTYLGDKTPEYKVIQDPDGEGWVLAEFNTFTGEYTAFDDDVLFDTVAEAKNYVDALAK